MNKDAINKLVGKVIKDSKREVSSWGKSTDWEIKRPAKSHHPPLDEEEMRKKDLLILKDTDNLADFFMLNSFDAGDKFVYVADNSFASQTPNPKGTRHRGPLPFLGIPQKVIDCIFVKAAEHGLVIRDDYWKNREFRSYFTVIHIIK